MPDGVALLKQKLLPFADDGIESPPGIFEVILRSSMISSSNQTQRNRSIADVYLNPPVENFGLLEFKSFDEIVEAGYDYANRVLDDEHLSLLK